MKVKEGESKGRDTHTRQTKNGTYEIVTTRTTCRLGVVADGSRFSLNVFARTNPLEVFE